MNDKTFEMTMLLDFYGELLTEKQRECMNLHYNEDLSLAEIAELSGITRQGVRDLIVRAGASLTSAEEKIGLIARFSQQREQRSEMLKKLTELEELTTGRARELVDCLKNELEAINL